ncbi:hypothetical protein IGI04_041081 [Brassica rapa subsp. trilocularis]|uniref:Ethylene insensitive 3-like DNA-binding domain-containing protein n=1 Tax=Brassica rapa subsp. trilocularis TaxID=1813537 RepID=A0ABQ7KPR0_BRACM|nr:hypothetical protein IGI04_041081 [Brassica rapa subsp. trilocularis]
MYNTNIGMFPTLVTSPVPRFPEGETCFASPNATCNDPTEEEMEIEELEKKIWKDKQRLKKLKEMSKNGLGRASLKQPPDDEHSRKRMMYQAQDGILKYMSKTMERCKAKGFVYGVVFENGRTVTGSSDNLRGWWRDQVRFDRNGPAAILKHQREINLSSTDGNELGSSEDGGDCTAHKEGSLWLAALNREKAIAAQSQKQPLTFSEEDGTGGEMDALFPEPADYEVEGSVGPRHRLNQQFHGFDNNNFNSGYNNKRRFEGESLHPGTNLTCENSPCPYSRPEMGFNDRVLRENHQMTCPYKQPTPFYQPAEPFVGMENYHQNTNNGNAQTVGMENYHQNQDQDLSMPWIQ